MKRRAFAVGFVATTLIAQLVSVESPAAVPGNVPTSASSHLSLSASVGDRGSLPVLASNTTYGPVRARRPYPPVKRHNKKRDWYGGWYDAWRRPYYGYSEYLNVYYPRTYYREFSYPKIYRPRIFYPRVYKGYDDGIPGVSKPAQPLRGPR